MKGSRHEQVTLSDLANLKIRIYVVGYSSRGESIVVLFMDGEKVIYSLVIDSCSYQGTNKTFEILNHYGLDMQKLNMLCWSHPDQDHTLRMNDLITHYCNNRTKILTPLGIVNPSFTVIDRNRDDDAVFSLIRRLNNSKKYVQKTVSVDDGHDKPYGFWLLTSDDEFEVEINALSPMDSYVNHYISNKKTTKKNHVSVVLQLKMPGGYSFLFCSDAEDIIFDSIMEEPFVDPLLVKIPHHGSNSSEGIFDILDTPSNNTLGCVTRFKSKNLPVSTTMAKYVGAMSRVDYTDQKRNNVNYGVIEYVVDLYDQRTININHDGRAGRYE